MDFIDIFWLFNFGSIQYGVLLMTEQQESEWVIDIDVRVYLRANWSFPVQLQLK